MKGNKQKAEYEEAEAKHGKPGGAEAEKPGSRKAEGRHPKSHCEAKRRRAERKKQRLSSRNRKISGRKEADRMGKDRKRKHKVST